MKGNRNPGYKDILKTFCVLPTLREQFWEGPHMFGWTGCSCTLGHIVYLVQHKELERCPCYDVLHNDSFIYHSMNLSFSVWSVLCVVAYVLHSLSFLGLEHWWIVFHVVHEVAHPGIVNPKTAITANHSSGKGSTTDQSSWYIDWWSAEPLSAFCTHTWGESYLKL